MQKDFSEKLDAYVRLERLMSDLYQLFSVSFPEDRELWTELVREEENHAAMIRAFAEHMAEHSLDEPFELFDIACSRLEETNEMIKTMIRRCKTSPPVRAESFRMAIEIESNAGEMHYQTFLEKKTQGKLERLFSELNGEDRDHVARIESWMSSVPCS